MRFDMKKKKKNNFNNNKKYIYIKIKKIKCNTVTFIFKQTPQLL